MQTRTREPSSEQLANDLIDELQAESRITPSIIAVSCDITKPDQCANLMSRAEAEFGAVDVLVNSATVARRLAFVWMLL